MEILDISYIVNDLQRLLPVRRYDNDNAQPGWGMPIALPGPLPMSIVFPMKLARGAFDEPSHRLALHQRGTSRDLCLFVGVRFQTEGVIAECVDCRDRRVAAPVSQSGPC